MVKRTVALISIVSLGTLFAAAEKASAAPGFSVSPASKAFGTIEPGFDSVPTVFTVTNTGSSNLVISSVVLGGSNPGQFAITGNECTSAVPAGNSCAIYVVFSPRVSSTSRWALAQVRITSNAAGSPHLIGLGGFNSAGGPQPDSAFKQSTGSPVPTANAPCDLVVGYIKNQKGTPDPPDLLMTDSILDQITVRNGDGHGNFPKQAPSSPTGTQGTRSCGVAVGDLDSDGRDEAVVSNRDSDDLSVFDEDDDGGLLPGPDLVPTGDEPETPELGDVDGDGDLDIVVPNTGDDDVSVIENDGDGNFTPDPTPVPSDPSGPPGAEPGESDLADMDDDGDLDIVVPNEGNDDVAVIENDGNGDFTPDTSPTPTGDQPTDAETADMDDDGFPDAVVPDRGDDQVEVLDNDGSGDLEPDPSPTPTDGGPTDVDLGDIDGDGEEDAAITAEDDGKINIYLGDGDGDFSGQPPGTPLDTQSTDPPLSLHDINEDGVVDILTTDDEGDVPLFLNRLDPESAFRKGTRLKAKHRQRFNRRGVVTYVYCQMVCNYSLRGKGLRKVQRKLGGNRWHRIVIPFTPRKRRSVARDLAAGTRPTVRVIGLSQGARKSRKVTLTEPREPYPVTG